MIYLVYDVLNWKKEEAIEIDAISFEGAAEKFIDEIPEPFDYLRGEDETNIAEVVVIDTMNEEKRFKISVSYNPTFEATAI